MDRPEVLILVVVASIQIRTLKPEVENGSMTTAVGHGLAGPEELVKSANSRVAGRKLGLRLGSSSEREVGQNSHALPRVPGGNTIDLRDASRCTGESCLFSFTEIGCRTSIKWMNVSESR